MGLTQYSARLNNYQLLFAVHRLNMVIRDCILLIVYDTNLRDAS